jgi:predicted DNA binding CopG/RHH family protein
MPRQKKPKKLILPKFKNEDEEREFWSRFDLSEYASTDDLVDVSFPNLKPTAHSISIRIPDYMLYDIKERANAIDIPYQALMKKYIADGIKRDNQMVKIK